jgi:tetratricopeptide (TPR) repeat protein
VSEVPYKDAVAAVPRLRALAKDDVYIGLADQYRPTDADFAAMVQSKPGSADDYFWRANAYLNRGKTDEALSDLSAGLEIDPKDLNLLGRRILIYTAKGNYTAAEKDVASVESIDPSNASIPGARAMIAEGKGDFQQCVVGYSKILEGQPNRTFALAHRAICESALGRNEAALADSSSALKQSPQMIDLRVLRANILMREGKRELVSAEADAMTTDNPKSDYAWVGAAKTYAALGMRDRAMKAFDRARTLKPSAYIFINRSSVRQRSDVKGRTADLDTALKLSPGNPDALSAKAQLLSESGDYKGALALLDSVKPDPSGNLFYEHYLQEHRAIILFKAGRTADADKLLSDLQTKTSDASELNNLCYDQATAGVRLNAALEACRAALKIKPDQGAYLDSLGMVLLKLGKLDDALDAYNRAIARNEGAASLMGRAFVYLQKGERARAEEDMAAARKLAPDIDETFAQYGLKLDQSSVQPHNLSQGATGRH